MIFFQVLVEETEITNFEKIGKNFYISNLEKNIKFTVNSNTFRIITADKIEKMTNGFKIIGIATRTTNKDNKSQKDLEELSGQFYAENILDVNFHPKIMKNLWLKESRTTHSLAVIKTTIKKFIKQ